MPQTKSAKLARIANLPLILPSGPHGLRSLLDTAFARVKIEPNIVAEIDGLAMLMDAVGGGLGVTIQPGAALARRDAALFHAVPVSDRYMVRPNQLVSLSDDELSPPPRGARGTGRCRAYACRARRMGGGNAAGSSRFVKTR